MIYIYVVGVILSSVHAAAAHTASKSNTSALRQMQSSAVSVPSAAREQAGLILDKSTSYWSILEQLCAELRLKPPTVEVSKKPAACSATVSVSYGFRSSTSYLKKADAQEDAARVALTTLSEADVETSKNCRAQLNEYCQRQQCVKPDYVPTDSAPFTCTVFVQVSHTSHAVPTEHEAKDAAAHGILTKLGHTRHILQVFDDCRFESFSVFCSVPSSEFLFKARYHFTRSTVGQTSRKAAEKTAARHALSVLYPDLDPKLPLDQCKNKLQEQYPQDKPKYHVSEDGGLFYCEVTVSFSEIVSRDNHSSVGVSESLAARALVRLCLIS